MSNQDWYSHQDWSTVVVHKSKAIKQMENKNKPKKQNAPGTKEFRKLDGNEIVKPKTVDKNVAKKLQQARCAKKLKQKEVAQIGKAVIKNVVFALEHPQKKSVEK